MELSIEKRDFNKAAVTWDQPNRVILARSIAHAVLSEVELTSKMQVLDFGCGTGLLTLHFQPLVNSITGVDSSQGMLDVLRGKIESQGLKNVRTECLDIENGELLKGTYDVIVSSMTLHHIREIQPLFNQFYKALTPGGYLCIADLDLDDGQFHENNEGVFHFGFDREIMRQVFVESGLREIRTRTAAEVIKTVLKRDSRSFTVFLATGQK
jgi:ubiquinone/menaquinone biosynthesis C-methylase UbiE